MSIKTVDSLEKAIAVAESVAEVRRRWGKQAKYGYSESQIVDALEIMLGGYKDADAAAHRMVTVQAAAEIAVTEASALRAQLTKANRQLAAANARGLKAAKDESARDALLERNQNG